MACRWDAAWKAEPSPGDLGFLVNEPGAGVSSLQLWHLLQALGLDPGGQRMHVEYLMCTCYPLTTHRGSGTLLCGCGQ